jgi:[ribosomal protein S18]-alanine N-acetyltransferase
VNVIVAPLAPPLPVEGSADAAAILALEAATQHRPLGLAALLREADTAPSGAPIGIVLLARDGAAEGRIVGMASARLLADEAHVIRLAVDARDRRRGVGRYLLDGLVAWADDRGASAVVLEVRAGNAAAQALYAAAGFAVEGRRPRYYPDGEDALLLRRMLTVPTGGAAAAPGRG